MAAEQHAATLPAAPTARCDRGIDPAKAVGNVYQPMITLERVSKRYGDDYVAVASLSLESPTASSASWSGRRAAARRPPCG